LLESKYDSTWSRLKAGDSKSLETLYREHVKLLINYGLRITASHDLVKDCIQDLFVELWKNRQNLADTTEPKFYLFKALRNKISRALSQKSFVSEGEIHLSLDGLVSDYIELDIIAKERELLNRKYLQELLKKLPRRQQEVVYLRFFHNFSYEAISAVMNMNYQSVLNLMQRALKTLRKGYSSISTD
jgi:RNA polymerase sigma-70 factor (ECF subfamily)